MADAEAELQDVWNRVQDGDDLDGRVDHGEAYIAYETATHGEARYFKLWVGLPDKDVEATPPAPVRQAVGTAMRVVPDTDFRPESGEMYTVVEV